MGVTVKMTSNHNAAEQSPSGLAGLVFIDSCVGEPLKRNGSLPDNELQKIQIQDSINYMQVEGESK